MFFSTKIFFILEQVITRKIFVIVFTFTFPYEEVHFIDQWATGIISEIW